MGLTMPLWERAQSRDGDLALSGCGVILAPGTVVDPDLLYVSGRRREILGSYWIEGAPDLLGEVISSRSISIDLVLKRDLYARCGVPYYWIAHPTEQWVRAYALGKDGQYELIAEGRGRGTFSAPPFPDLTIQLASLWFDPFDDE